MPHITLSHTQIHTCSTRPVTPSGSFDGGDHKAVFIVCSCRLCVGSFRADGVGVAPSNMTSNFIKASQEQLVLFFAHILWYPAVPGLFMQGSPSVSAENVGNKKSVGGGEAALLANWKPHLTDVVPSDVISIQMLCCGRMKEPNRHDIFFPSFSDTRSLIYDRWLDAATDARYDSSHISVDTQSRLPKLFIVVIFEVFCWR